MSPFYSITPYLQRGFQKYAYNTKTKDFYNILNYIRTQSLAVRSETVEKLIKNKGIRHFFKEQNSATLQVKESGTPSNVSLSLWLKNKDTLEHKN